MRYMFSILLSGFFALHCGREQRPQTQTPAVTKEIATTSPESLSTILGKAFFDGVPPKMPNLSMNADRKCAGIHEQPVRSEQVIVDSNGFLQNVFLYIKQGVEGRVFTVPSDTVVLDQEGCMYKPHIVGMQVNQPLLIINSDPTLHNIHAITQLNRGFNIAQPRRGMKTERTFTRPEVMIRVKCDVHPWMASYIGVLDHPYYSVTGAEGSAMLRNIPPGEYVVAAWHERYGEQEQHITIGASEDKMVEFRFKE